MAGRKKNNHQINSHSSSYTLRAKTPQKILQDHISKVADEIIYVKEHGQGKSKTQKRVEKLQERLGELRKELDAVSTGGSTAKPIRSPSFSQNQSSVYQPAYVTYGFSTDSAMASLESKLVFAVERDMLMLYDIKTALEGRRYDISQLIPLGNLLGLKNNEFVRDITNLLEVNRSQGISLKGYLDFFQNIIGSKYVIGQQDIKRAVTASDSRTLITLDKPYIIKADKSSALLLQKYVNKEDAQEYICKRDGIPLLIVYGHKESVDSPWFTSSGASSTAFNIYSRSHDELEKAIERLSDLGYYADSEIDDTRYDSNTIYVVQYFLNGASVKEIQKSLGKKAGQSRMFSVQLEEGGYYTVSNGIFNHTFISLANEKLYTS